MASSSTAYYLKDAGFHIRNIPKAWNDWNLFHVFQNFGKVSYCRVVGQSNDGQVQLGFVNMMSVADADEVRKNLNDGNLIGENFTLKVTDHKNVGGSLLPMASNSVQKLVSSPPSKSGPVLLSSSWLPLNKDIEVEVVDYLPSSSVAPDLFALTLLRINDSSMKEKYDSMHEKMNAYAQIVPFDSELEIGYDGVFRDAPRSVRRVRRISATKLYLVDFGKIINYEKAKCFQLPKVFQSMPTRVSLCGLDGLTWSPVAIPSFDNIREVVKKWGQMENSTLHAMACGFQGSINMINLFCGKSILADRLQRKGVCEYLPRSQQPHYAYSRETLLQHNNSGVTAQISNDADVVKDLLKKIDGVKNMLRELEL
ncbi:Embryonic developmental protein tofu-6 [Caenorhabditis elegans]|uniref:Embryonic developmental protein tofu-6 n=2 Tax=Caenorhabditis elegans TaxID=6239 RepID=TOFU6_CAEEL|nr:Embryonic developmental protein tofu-6 [Caenorhabditis elegans]Q09293.2 RecName: Full=Embryonic developmental protein tofu-6; AltName: Full=21U-RNA biogenesis fouled up protein 6; AltName: Full=Maternal effect lethal protein 47 [Caenorhabditis elegans]AAG50209.1 2F713 [Caenorhabditis elegans]CCD68728.1 Embryonic developmental protein tofu-6 [Caenorhabditis elegans]|eukprot:NP_001293507.1 Embryonic developmental protein tofu-6 [Caenorhabditis elegans]